MVRDLGSVEVGARPVTVLRAPSWRDALSAANLSRLAAFRDLLTTLSIHRINVRYRQSLLGSAWAILQPLAMMVIYTVVFSRLVRMPSDNVPYALFAYAGLLPWTFFSTAVSTGTGSLLSHSALVTKVSFPREILPLTYVAAAFVDLLIASLVLLAMLAWYRVPLTVHAASVLPALAVAAVLSTAVSLVLAAVQVRFRDVGVALPVVLQLLMFASPVLYPLHVVPARWYPWYVLNPIAGIVDTFRAAVLGQTADVHALTLAALASVFALPLAYLAFKRVDRTMADLI